MKHFTILAAVAALMASTAHADPVTVAAPKAPVSSDAAEAYIVSLEMAIKRVCREATGPVVGVAYYSYLACIKDTRLEVAKQDPTGLYAAAGSRADLVVAAR